MGRVVFHILLALLFSFGWADDFYRTSQTADPYDDCCSGEDDFYDPCCKGGKVNREAEAHVPPPEHTPYPGANERSRSPRQSPRRSDAGGLAHGTAPLYLLLSLQC